MASGVFNYFFTHAAVQAFELLTLAVHFSKKLFDDRLARVGRFFVAFVEDAQRL